MFKPSNLITLHLFLLHQISFNVLYIKSNYEFTSNTGGKRRRGDLLPETNFICLEVFLQ